MLRLQARPADHPRHELLKAEGRRSGQDAVVVVREAGRLQHRRAAAVRAALDVGVVDLPAVVVLDDPLGRPGREMHAAIGVVEQGLGLPHVVAVLALVAGVGRGHCEATAEQARRVADEARGAADGAEHHPAVPVVGEGDLEADRPVDDAAYPAVGRHTFRGGHPEPRLDRVVEVGQGDQATAVAASVVGGKRRYGNQKEQQGEGKTSSRHGCSCTGMCRSQAATPARAMSAIVPSALAIQTKAIWQPGLGDRREPIARRCYAPASNGQSPSAPAPIASVPTCACQ